MAGQVIKRGDKNWLVRVFMGRDGNGKRRYLNKTIRGNKKDADKYLRDTLTKNQRRHVRRTSQADPR